MVGETVCADGFQGVVRREDVRGWEVEGVVCAEGFRVGDVVRGVVVSFFFFRGWNGMGLADGGRFRWGTSRRII